MASAPQTQSSSPPPGSAPAPGGWKAALKELWETRKVAGAVIATVLAVVGGLTPFIKRSLNEPLKLPMVDVVACGVLFAAVLGSVVWLGFANVKQRGELQRLGAAGRIPLPSLLPVPTQLDDILTPSLDIIRQQPRLNNRVQLEHYSEQCKLHGSGMQLDVTCIFTLKGRNISSEPLTELLLPIVGDNLARFYELGPKYFDMLNDSGKQKPRKPQLRSTDEMYKRVVLGFDSPGVGPHKDFHLELQYTWPATFNRHKDYWFIDNTGFEGETEKLSLELDVSVMEPVIVTAYAVERDTDKKHALGRANMLSQGVYTYSPATPQKDLFYVLLVAEA